MNFSSQGINNIRTYFVVMDKNKELPEQKDESFARNTQKQEYELQKLANLNKGLISFKGFSLDDFDREFLGELSQNFNVSKDDSKKLEKILKDFLKENDFTSIADMAGDDFSYEQSQLLDRFNSVLKLEDEDYQDLVDMIIAYSDSSFDDEDDIDNLLDFELFDNIAKDVIAQIKKNDIACLDSICETFGFNDEQKKRLYDIVYKTLHEDKLMSIKSLENEDNVEIDAIIQERIAQEFNLSEDESLIVSNAFTQRIFSNESSYIPLTNPLDRNIERCSKDNTIFNRILSNYDLSTYDENRLHAAMKHDAYNAGFESIFELFNRNNNFTEFKETNKVLNSENFLQLKNDLLIDFNIANKNQAKILENVRQQGAERGNLYKKTIAVICNLNEKIDLSEEDIKKIKYYLMKSKDDFGTNPAKAAYELSEIINKENSFDKIHATIKEISVIPDDNLKDYGFEYCNLIISKKSQN